MAIALTLVVGLSSCGDDYECPSVRDIAKEYTGNEIAVTNGGEALNGGSAKIEVVNDATLKLTLNNIVNGQPSFDMDAAVVKSRAEVVSTSSQKYSFTGSKSIDGMNVTVEGVAANGKVALDVLVEMTGANLLKAWTFNTTADNQTDFLIFDLQNKSDKVMFGGNEVTTAEFNVNAGTWITLIAGMSLQDLSLTFGKDGYIGLSATSPMAPEGQQNISLPKLARYYYSPAANLLLFDVPMDGLVGEGGAISGTMQVPFICKIENGVLSATIQPEFLSMILPFIPKGEALAALLSKLDSVFPPDLAFFLPIIKGIINDVVVGITDPDVTSLTIGAKLKPVAPVEE